MSTHCATGDWEDEIARINLIIPTTVWKGTGPITLTMHYNTHKDLNELVRTCGIHVTDPNLPLEQQNVYNLIRSISITSPEILVALSMICFNPSLQYSLDKTVAWLISSDPKKKYSKKQTTDNIGDVEVMNGIGETGVHLRFHTSSGYERLSGTQRAEFHNWRHSSAGKRSATGDPEGGAHGRYGGHGGQG